MGRYLRKGFSLEVLTRMGKEGALVARTCEKQDKTESWHLPCASALRFMLKFISARRGQSSVVEKITAASLAMSGDKQAGLWCPSVQ